MIIDRRSRNRPRIFDQKEKKCSIPHVGLISPISRVQQGLMSAAAERVIFLKTLGWVTRDSVLYSSARSISSCRAARIRGLVIRGWNILQTDFYNPQQYTWVIGSWTFFLPPLWKIIIFCLGVVKVFFRDGFKGRGARSRFFIIPRWGLCKGATIRRSVAARDRRIFFRALYEKITI